MAQMKIRIGQWLHPIDYEESDKFYFFSFPYNPPIVEEMRCLEGSKWMGHDESNPQKVWRVPKTHRNLFQLEYLQGRNPYAQWDAIKDLGLVFNRPLYSQQKEFVNHILNVKACIIAGEMGVGKTLSAIEVMERLAASDAGIKSFFYVAPTTVIAGIQLELDHWNARIPNLTFFTYEGLKNALKTMSGPPPQCVFFDESSRLKTHTAQRSQAALHLANEMRSHHGVQNCYIVLMSGTPAPKSPLDWWMQCEIACPGFLREGKIEQFKKRLAITKTEEAQHKYTKVVTWRDNERKCDICGLVPEEHALEDHDHKPSINEVHKLYERMKGLVTVKFKKDCLDLPEKRFEIVDLKPSRMFLQLARTITATAPSAIVALTRLRELSDGFQYQDVKKGLVKCELCGGIGRVSSSIAPDGSNAETVTCPSCSGTGTVHQIAREVVSMPCPKDTELLADLDRHEEVGRLNVYAGFTGSLDKIQNLVRSAGWDFLRVDGAGARSSIPGLSLKDMLGIFQYGQEDHPRICYIGHPASGGLGITLTASPTTVFFSNDFSAESRRQAADRHHRIGMDVVRGGLIRDYCHLPTDRLVLENIQKKIDLELMTLGDLQSGLEEVLNVNRD